MREKGILIVVSGFSGSGKGTIMNYPFLQLPEIHVREKKTDGSIFLKQ